MSGHQQTAVGANEPGPADRKIPLPPARPCHLLLPLARELWGWGKGASQMGPTGLFKVYSTPQKSYSKDQLLSLVGFCSCAEVTAQACCLMHADAAGWPRTGTSTLEKDIISKEMAKTVFLLDNRRDRTFIF